MLRAGGRYELEFSSNRKYSFFSVLADQLLSDLQIAVSLQ